LGNVQTFFVDYDGYLDISQMKVTPHQIPLVNLSILKMRYDHIPYINDRRTLVIQQYLQTHILLLIQERILYIPVHRRHFVVHFVVQPSKPTLVLFFQRISGRDGSCTCVLRRELVPIFIPKSSVFKFEQFSVF